MRDEELKELVNKPRRKLGEFRVGDIVACKEPGEYTYTDVGVRCRVVEIIPKTPRTRRDEMRVEIIRNGEKWVVNAQHFELLEESQA